MTASRAVETALRSGNGTIHVPFPSSQVVKATPWLCQECTCSPPREEPREWRVRSTTPPSYLRQVTVSAAQGKRRLGQGMPRTMGHSQVRKWSKPHRGFAKNALAHPLHRGGYHKESFPKITSARRVSLRCGTQFVPAGHTYHTWQLLSNKDKKGRGRYRCFKSTVSTPRREDFPKGKICGETQTITPSVTLPT